ncbi:prolyl-tRNA synthetase associated domain-containing protein [Candidatus Woesearchaeota archaeon]|nr:prolyl-tRNA synthetase associated domain-containing protein [Candidatus Woesearchaeota archaeon]
MTLEVIGLLEKHHIAYKLHTHKAVFTCAEAEEHCKHIPGLACKNLFLKDKYTHQCYLVILPAAKKMDFKKFEKMLGSKKIMFGDENQLMDILKLTKGAVSPFGLLNDTELKTEVYIDQEVWEADIVSFHPNINTETLELSKEMFQKFIKTLKHIYTVILF